MRMYLLTMVMILACCLSASGEQKAGEGPPPGAPGDIADNQAQPNRKAFDDLMEQMCLKYAKGNSEASREILREMVTTRLSAVYKERGYNENKQPVFDSLGDLVSSIAADIRLTQEGIITPEGEPGAKAPTAAERADAGKRALDREILETAQESGNQKATDHALEKIQVRAENDLLKKTIDRLKGELQASKDASGLSDREKLARNAAVVLENQLHDEKAKVERVQIQKANLKNAAEDSIDLWHSRAEAMRQLAAQRGDMIRDLWTALQVAMARADATEDMLKLLRGANAAARRQATAMDNIAHELRQLNWEISKPW